MMDHIIAHLDALQGALGNSVDIDTRDLARLNATINQLRRDARHAMTRPARAPKIPNEIAQQARLQGELGYLPVIRAFEDVHR